MDVWKDFRRHGILVDQSVRHGVGGQHSKTGVSAIRKEVADLTRLAVMELAYELLEFEWRDLAAPPAVDLTTQLLQCLL